MAEIFSEYRGTQGPRMLPENNNYNPYYPAAQANYSNNPVVSQRTLKALLKDDHETFNAIEKRRIMNTMDYETFKNKLDYKEEVRRRNELSTTSIYWDARGELKIEISSPKGPIKSERLCDLRKSETKITLYKPVDTDCMEKPIYVVSYRIGEYIYHIPISAEEYGRGKLLKKMMYNGISFYISQKKQNEIACDFEAFILSESHEVMIPLAHGWYIVDGRWGYASESKLIWEDIKNGRYN
ncbi:hypothetical protein [Lacrimispora sp.]|uniref:hypothetical protein n=1 Tax=Lacrimispora sp. TaxID=2719234 RepID=UPI0039927677